MKVKVCGITNREDAAMAIELGADALGFIFAPSPRQITPEKAGNIIWSLPPFVKKVGVFVNEAPAEIRRIRQVCGLDLVQLHGDEPPAICAEFMPYAIKAFRLKDESTLQAIKPYRENVTAFLFDTYTKDKRGGTGMICNWDLASKGKKLGIPIILAGGLTPSNVQAAVTAVRPYAIDVNSGVEQSPGKKSPDLLKTLMENVKNTVFGGANLD